MEKEIVFCSECRKEVTYSIIPKQLESSINSIKYKYLGNEVYCDQCGSELFIDQIYDENLKNLYDEYRKANNIVALDIIRQLPKKYRIGKRPLSLLLGWGEQTLTRYYDGDIPTKQYSDILLKIYHDPYFYLEILEKNKKNLKSNSTYEKSKKAVSLLLNHSETKIELVVQYLLQQCQDITPLALQKTLYYVQAFYFCFNNKFIFEDDCEAWIHGPVYKNIYTKYKDYRFDLMSNFEEFDKSVFTANELAVLDSVIKYFGCFSGKVLEAFTHNEDPWLITRGQLLENEPSNRIIEKQLISDYFMMIKAKYDLINYYDIKCYASDLFKKIL